MTQLSFNSNCQQFLVEPIQPATITITHRQTFFVEACRPRSMTDCAIQLELPPYQLLQRNGWTSEPEVVMATPLQESLMELVGYLDAAAAATAASTSGAVCKHTSERGQGTVEYVGEEGSRQTEQTPPAYRRNCGGGSTEVIRRPESMWIEYVFEWNPLMAGKLVGLLELDARSLSLQCSQCRSVCARTNYIQTASSCTTISFNIHNNLIAFRLQYCVF